MKEYFKEGYQIESAQGGAPTLQRVVFEMLAPKTRVLPENVLFDGFSLHKAIGPVLIYSNKKKSFAIGSDEMVKCTGQVRIGLQVDGGYKNLYNGFYVKGEWSLKDLVAFVEASIDDILAAHGITSEETSTDQINNELEESKMNNQGMVQTELERLQGRKAGFTAFKSADSISSDKPKATGAVHSDEYYANLRTEGLLGSDAKKDYNRDGKQPLWFLNHSKHAFVPYSGYMDLSMVKRSQEKTGYMNNDDLFMYPSPVIDNKTGGYECDEEGNTVIYNALTIIQPSNNNRKKGYEFSVIWNCAGMKHEWPVEYNLKDGKIDRITIKGLIYSVEYEDETAKDGKRQEFYYTTKGMTKVHEAQMKTFIYDKLNLILNLK